MGAVDTPVGAVDTPVVAVEDVVNSFANDSAGPDATTTEKKLALIVA